MSININENLEDNYKSIRKKCIFQTINFKRDVFNKSFHREVAQKGKELKTLFGETGIENKKELITFFKDTKFDNTKKKNIQKYILRANKLNEKNKEMNSNNSFNSINLHNHSLHSLTDKDYSIDNNSTYNHSISSFKNNTKYVINRNLKTKNEIKESKSFYNNKKVKLVLGNKKYKNFNDYEKMNLTTYSTKTKNLYKTLRNNNSEEKKYKFSKDYYKNNADEITKRIRKIMSKNIKIKNKLNNVLNNGSSLPFVPNSFIDLIHIGNKQFQIERPGKFKIKNLDAEEKFKEQLKNYWIEREADKGYLALLEKNNQMKRNIENKIHKDIILAKKINLELKFGPKNLDFYKRFRPSPNKLIIVKPNVNK